MAIKPVESESDLPSRENNDSFWIKRIFKFTLLVVALVVIVIVAGLFCHTLITDPTYRNGTLVIVQQQLGTIVGFVIAILGLKTWGG